MSSNVKLQTEDAVEDDEDVQRIEGEGHPLSVREKIALRRHSQRDDLIVRRLSKNEGDEIESESDKTEGDKHDGSQKSEEKDEEMGSRGVESPTAHLYDDGVLGAEAKARPSPSSTHGTPLDSVGDVLRGIGGLGSDSQGTTL